MTEKTITVEKLRSVWTRAMADPGAFVGRKIELDREPEHENGLEPLIDWQLRALLAALATPSQEEQPRCGLRVALERIARGEVPNVEFAKHDLVSEFAEDALAAAGIKPDDYREYPTQPDHLPVPERASDAVAQPRRCGGTGRVVSVIIDGEPRYRDCAGCEDCDPARRGRRTVSQRPAKASAGESRPAGSSPAPSASIGGETCHSCGEPVAATCPTYWLTDDDLWNEVEGGPTGLRCIRCFALDCEQAGIPIFWRALREPEPLPVPEEDWKARAEKAEADLERLELANDDAVDFAANEPEKIARCLPEPVRAAVLASGGTRLESEERLRRAFATQRDEAWATLAKVRRALGEDGSAADVGAARAALAFTQPEHPAVPEHVGGDGADITISVSLEGAKSFVSDSPGWGAIGLQEITEALLCQLRRAGHEPPYEPSDPDRKGDH